MLQKTACFLVIGNEILSGRTQDANTRVLAQALNAQGIRLMEVRVIPDIDEWIIRTVRECSAAFDLVFTSGGIGPTHDDITAECVATAMGAPLVRHEESFSLLEAALGKERFNTARQRMAYLPEGATPILNTVSVAPGFSIGNVHVMAGVPAIFASMVAWLVPQLEKGAPLVSASWHAVGLKEGDFASDLATLQETFPTIDLGSYPYHLPEGSGGVALVAKGYDAGIVEKAALAIHDLIMAHGREPLSGEPPHRQGA
ncbi:competence/damage-inducible protein A [Gluconobacter kanchanaburiensis]|uniref:Molybdenum cofactor biosynthesis protein n=1 Tax=Gluconobacter kanchanaburiensis NBRC 103587 TaxID=1307948 RepID=A0A511B3K5_9PROT|nr:competence/damage-inducible protein A [Gluconobacter kanchanaburiensis]MBF0860825.1 competence/damage-inducible protein A [Gluconobacter kanchanaburiensis]GBR69866.1 competence-damage protein [Gluconobacter kanchanaburiensis NBRC 103587]GEK94998.1 molybdenum cofactor biosynthesis protein [Gluconobacter kanchanaburiensis NBRC 103587]